MGTQQRAWNIGTFDLESFHTKNRTRVVDSYKRSQSLLTHEIADRPVVRPVRRVRNRRHEIQDINDSQIE